MYLAGIDWQGVDRIGENYNFDVIPLGVSGLRYKKTYTLHVFVLLWCITLAGETIEIEDFLAKIKRKIAWLRKCSQRSS